MTNELTITGLLRDEITAVEATLQELRQMTLQFDAGFASPMEEENMTEQLCTLFDRHTFTSTEVESGKSWTERGLTATLDSLVFWLIEAGAGELKVTSS